MWHIFSKHRLCFENILDLKKKNIKLCHLHRKSLTEKLRSGGFQEEAISDSVEVLSCQHHPHFILNPRHEDGEEAADSRVDDFYESLVQEEFQKVRIVCFRGNPEPKARRSRGSKEQVRRDSQELGDTAKEGDSLEEVRWQEDGGVVQVRSDRNGRREQETVVTIVPEELDHESATKHGLKTLKNSFVEHSRSTEMWQTAK